MTDEAWLSSEQQLVPGAEVFRSDRRFQLWAYGVSHSQLLLRSNGGYDSPDPLLVTTIEVLFKPVTVVKIRDVYDGLVIRRATEAEADHVKSATPSIEFLGTDRVFALDTQGETDYVVASAVGWHEGVLSRTRLSFYASVDPYEPSWPRTVLGGLDAGFTIASTQDLVASLKADPDSGQRRDRWRTVFVVMVKVTYPKEETESYGAGVFVARSDAEEFMASIREGVTDSWIEELPIAV